MAINVEINKKKNESNASVLKRFSRKVQESGVLKYTRTIRYADRAPSDFVKKKKKLKSINKTAEIQQKIKLGKITPKSRGRK